MKSPLTVSFAGAAIASMTLAATLLFTGCSGGSSSSDTSGGSGSNSKGLGGLESADFDCDGACPAESLSTSDVELVLRNAILGAQSVGVAATFSVVDRVGNVLAVYQMAGANPSTKIDGQIGAVGGLEGASVPSTLAAISKAGTGAFLSSQGNAFSTRTASQIIQEHFNPGEFGGAAGPLFGVQFSQLPCSDVTKSIAPRPLPLGLAADPGGIPLYRNGDMIGGLGVEFDGSYRLDRNIQDFDNDLEERVALIASRGFEAPSDRIADAMYVGGKSLRFVDLSYDELGVLPAVLPELDPAALKAVPPFTPGGIRAGVPFGSVASGVANTVRAGIPSMILVDGAGNNRFPTIGGAKAANGAELTPKEVDAILDSALLTAFRARAAIRRPRETYARVSIWVIDHLGNPLGFTRTQDAPVFGIDVSLQKARAAALFSSADASERLIAAGLGQYVSQSQALLGPDAFTGKFAFSNRAIGNLARPFIPDGIRSERFGPLSHRFPSFSTGGEQTWSPFNDGIQLDLVLNGLLAPLSGTIPDSCSNSAVFGRRAQNGIQIFPGAVPLYRNGVLIGAVGVSGDGIDQDDMVSFLGSSRKGLDFAGHTDIGDPELGFAAPQAIRSDSAPLAIGDLRLRYVSCPETPFVNQDDQGVCAP